MKMQKITENENTIQNSKEQPINQERNRNLYIAGRLGVYTLKTILKCAKHCFIPTVKAAPKETPKRPPPMKYKDLPIYDSPFYHWKQYENDKDTCPERRLTHEYLLPTVTEYRKQVTDIVKTIDKEMKDTYQEVTRDYRSAEKNILSKLRSPDNMNLRMALVAGGAITGLKLGKSIPRRVFYSSVLAFVAGSACFPKETDETTRTVLYMIGKAFVPLYNFYFREDWVLRERVPCVRDLPQIPPPTKPLPVCAPAPKK